MSKTEVEFTKNKIPMDLSLSPLVFPLSAKELSRWTRFALRGGIGKGTCLFDREVAEEGDLMFFKEEEIIYLLALNEDQYLVSLILL